MFRYLIRFALSFTALLTLIGLLVIHAWDGDAVPPNDLYAIYLQRRAGVEPAFMIARVDGQGDAEQLRWEHGPLTALKCSPDGRIFAFMIDSDQLYVVTRDGLAYQQFLRGQYPITSVANDGSVALTDYNRVSWLADSKGYRQMPTPEAIPDARYGSVRISSDGLALWQTDAHGVVITTLEGGRLVDVIADARTIDWLGSEQSVVYQTISPPSAVSAGNTYYTHWIMDVPTHHKLRLNDPNFMTQYAPSGETVLLGTMGAESPITGELVSFNPITNQVTEQITHDPLFDYEPICFLRFRPEVLIGQTP